MRGGGGWSTRRRSPERARSGRWIGLLALGSSATGRGGATGAHRGFEVGRAAAQGHRCRGQAAARGAVLVVRSVQGSSGFRTPRIDSPRHCGGSTGDQGGPGSPEARNRVGAVSSPARNSLGNSRACRPRCCGWRPWEASWCRGGAAVGRLVHGGVGSRRGGAAAEMLRFRRLRGGEVGFRGDQGSDL